MKKVYVPGSKSITNRALLLAALSGKSVVLHNILDSDDSRYMRRALETLGVQITPLGRNSVRITPPTELLAAGDELFIGNAGTAARFLSALSLVIAGQYTLTGVERMQERPQADLFAALSELGVSVACDKNDGFLPATFTGLAGLAGTSVSISGEVSSQFLSGLMLVAPRLEAGLEIHITDSIPSRPYVEMTLEMLKLWGAKVAVSDAFDHFTISPGFNAPTEYTIPSDMSSTSYPLAWSVLRGTPISIENFGESTLQGDEQFVEVIKATGAKVSRSGAKLQVEPQFDLQPLGDWNFSAMPDVSMTAMVLAAFCPGESTFTGLESLRVKECDRIFAMEQLTQLGVPVSVEGDVVTIAGGASLKIMDGEANINSYDDHRIAMCFALAKAAIDLGADPRQESLIKITEPECVAKTWPDFWLALADWENQLRGVAGIILRRNDEYLIVKKPRKNNAWQFPQGGRDEGETGKQAALRELAEECGANLNAKLKGERPVGQYAYFFPEYFDRHRPGMLGAKVDFFLADFVSGKVEVDGEEIVDHAWLTTGEFKNYFSAEYQKAVKDFLTEAGGDL